MAKNLAGGAIASGILQGTLKENFPPPPPVPTQTYTFSFDSFEVKEPRSGSLGGFDKGNDSDYCGFTYQVNNNAPQTITKFIGNNCHSGTFQVNLPFDSVKMADTDAVVLMSTIVNSSQGETATVKYLTEAMQKVTSAGGTALINLLKNQILTQAVKDEIGAAIGATLGTAVVPLLGSALGALGGFLVGEAWGILFPNCDGPVAASVFVYSGAELRAGTAGGKLMTNTVNYPGIDSADGCGDNSNYNASYHIQLVPTLGIIIDRPIIEQEAGKLQMKT